MGKEISHILCAEQTLASLAGTAGEGFTSLLKDHAREFHFGSIAADTFFYGIKSPLSSGNPSRCGDLIHGAEGVDTGRPIHEMLKELRDAPNDPLFGAKAAFVGGFLSHVALDSIIHPFVYHVSGNYYAECPVERKEARVRHRLVESWLDLHLMTTCPVASAGYAGLADIRGNGAVNRALLGFLFDAFERSLEIDPANRKELMRGYRVQMALNSVYGRPSVAGLVRRVDRLLSGRLETILALFYPWGYGEVPRELTHFESFLHPVTGERRGGGLSGLWGRAVGRSGEFLLSLERFLFQGGNDDELRSSVQGYNLSTGLVGVSMKEAVHYACIPMERLVTF